MKQIGLLGSMLCLCVSSPAWADPYTRAKGEGRVIINGIHSGSSKAFDDNGDSQNIPDYNQDHLYITGEYGVTDDLTVVVAPSLQRIKQDGYKSHSGLGYTDVGVKYRVA